MGLNQKLILGFLSVALMGAVIGYVAVDTSQNALQESIGDSSTILAIEILNKIDRDISGRIADCELYSKCLVLQQVVARSNRKFDKLGDVQAYINKKDKQWTSVPKEEVTDFMKGLMDSVLSKDLQRKVEFYKSKYGYSVFGEIYVANKYGAVIAASGKTTDYYQADEQWYQAAMQEKEFWVGEVEYDESSGVLAADIVIKLYGEEAEFAGILKATLNVEEIINLIKEAKVASKYENVEFKLVTKDARNIYSTNKHKFSENVSKELQPCLAQLAKDHKCLIVEGKRLFAHAHSEGYRAYEGLGWVLVIEYGEEIFAPVVQLRNRILNVASVLVILAIFSGALISSAISKHIARLKYATVQIGKGNLDTQVEVASNDGMGDLAESLNEMAHNVKEVTDELNKEISGHKQTEQSLRESEERLLKAQQVARIGFLDWNLVTNEVYWSDEIFELYGVDPEGTRPSLDLTMRMVHPDDMERVQHNFGMAAKGIGGYDITHRVLRPDGQVIYVHAQAKLTRDEDGKPVGLLGTVVDVTKYKEAEEESKRYREELEQLIAERSYGLKRSNEQLQEEIVSERQSKEREISILKRRIEFILGATRTGMDIIDSEFNIRYIDPEWKKIYGETEGKKCYEYFMDETKPCPDCGIPKALKTKKPVVSEEVLVKEGNRPIRVTTIPFQDENGQWLVAEVNVDISDLKKAEEDLGKCKLTVSSEA